MHEWRTIDTAPKDGSTVLVWDGEVFAYPVAVRWAWEPVCERAYKAQQKRNWPVVACKPGEWRPIEQEMIDIADWIGGLRPTHWMSWAPAPTPATMVAWGWDEKPDLCSQQVG